MFDVEIRDFAPAEAACLPHKGAYSRISSTFGQLVPHLVSGSHVPVGPRVGLYYHSPSEGPEAAFALMRGVRLPRGPRCLAALNGSGCPPGEWRS